VDIFLETTPSYELKQWATTAGAEFYECGMHSSSSQAKVHSQ